MTGPVSFVLPFYVCVHAFVFFSGCESLVSHTRFCTPLLFHTHPAITQNMLLHRICQCLYASKTTSSAFSSLLYFRCSHWARLYIGSAAHAELLLLNQLMRQSRVARRMCWSLLLFTLDIEEKGIRPRHQVCELGFSCQCLFSGQSRMALCLPTTQVIYIYAHLLALCFGTLSAQVAKNSKAQIQRFLLYTVWVKSAQKNQSGKISLESHSLVTRAAKLWCV